jgi:hypothetical protein
VCVRVQVSAYVLCMSCVYVCVHVHACVHAYVCVCMHEYVCVCLCPCVCASVGMYACMSTCARMHVSMCVCTCVCVCAFACVRVCLYACVCVPCVSKYLDASVVQEASPVVGYFGDVLRRAQLCNLFAHSLSSSLCCPDVGKRFV